jgi:hypothetical protein
VNFVRSIHLTNFLLLIIAAFLGVIAFGPLFRPVGVHGQATAIGQLPISSFPQLFPGDPITSTFGPYLLDTATGNIWGYPVLGADAFGPPILLGTFTQPGQPIMGPSLSGPIPPHPAKLP